MLFIDDSAGTRRMALSSNRAAQRFRHLATSPEAMAIFFFERIKQQSRYWKLLHWPGICTAGGKREGRETVGKIRTDNTNDGKSWTTVGYYIDDVGQFTSTLYRGWAATADADLPTNARTHRPPSIPSLLLVVPLSIEDTPSTLLSDIISSLYLVRNPFENLIPFHLLLLRERRRRRTFFNNYRHHIPKIKSKSTAHIRRNTISKKWLNLQIRFTRHLHAKYK